MPFIPYRKSDPVKLLRYRRRFVPRQEAGVMKTGTLTPEQRQAVRRMIHATEEQKHYGAYQANVGFSYGGSEYVQDVTIVGQGSGAAQRTGEEVTWDKLELRVAFTVADTYNHVRILVFQWFADTQVDVPTAAKVLDLSAVASTAYSYQAPYNVTTPPKFKILYDSEFMLAGAGTAADPIQEATSKSRHIVIPGNRGRKTITFNGALTNGMNHLYVMALSDSVVVNHPLLSYGGHFTYTDS